MILYLYLILPLLSFVMTLIDTSFLSYYEIFNATIISTFCLTLVLSVANLRRPALLFGAYCILFLSAFSSIPLYAIMLAYLGIPLLIFYSRNRMFFGSAFLPSVALFLAANLVFRLLLLALNFELTEGVVWSIIFFPILNTLFCIILFVLLKKFNQVGE